MAVGTCLDQQDHREPRRAHASQRSPEAKLKTTWAPPDTAVPYESLIVQTSCGEDPENTKA